MARPVRIEEPVIQALASLSREAPVSATARGHCMQPLVEDGAEIELAGRRFYWPGDVVGLALTDGRLAVHRVLGCVPWKGRLCLVTRGDHSPRHDAPVPAERVVGRVVGGQCSERAVRVPLRDRLRAAARLGRIIVSRPFRRLSGAHG